MRSLVLACTLSSGCGLFGGNGDGGDGMQALDDLTMLPDLAEPFDFAGAPDGADLNINPNRMDVTWRIFDARFDLVNCDDPRVLATTVVFVAVENANGATAKTTLSCPAGMSQGSGFIDLTNNMGQFTVTATAPGTASQPASDPAMPYYGEAVDGVMYLPTDDMM
jgi:hypothetical protein